MPWLIGMVVLVALALAWRAYERWMEKRGEYF